jgi:diguanylate cyclase (GGDEF)-like protein
VHHDRPTDSHPGWPAQLIAAALGFTFGVITTRRRSRRQLAAARAQALHDPLTGLPNRRAALAEVHTRLAGGPFLLALLDLDDFKQVNDSHGHLVGDDLLRIVAARLYLAIPPDGFAARLAGDEFLILLPDHDGDPADMITAVLTLLAQPVTIAAATLRPHASAGVATTAGGAASWRQLLARADHALYRAKATGHTVAVHDLQLDPPTTPDGPRPHTRRRDHRPGNPTAGPSTPNGT